MTEENKPAEVQPTEIKSEGLVDKAYQAAQRLEEANKRTEELLARQEQILARQMLSGRAEGGQPQLTKEDMQKKQIEDQIKNSLKQFNYL